MEITETIRSWLSGMGLKGGQLDFGVQCATVAGIALAAIVVNFIAKRIILQVVKVVAGKTHTEWDDVMLDNHVFTRLSHIAPALVIWFMAPVLAGEGNWFAGAMKHIAEIYMLLVGLAVIFAFLRAVEVIYGAYEIAKRVPITSYSQVLKLVLSIGVGVISLSIVLDKSPWVFLSGLGAATAILLLVFKDSILGFVAGIQLTANDMVRPGDWISMPKYGADGDVIEMNLTTVKVRNWDKTISMVPTYALISDSFQNWRGMTESGGRRIKRCVNIDVNSIRFCTPEMIERFGKIERIKEYVKLKTEALERYNQKYTVDSTMTVNGRRMTNVGTFRAYLVAYLKENPKIHKDMTFLVRQLQPTELGLPLEIYVFSNDQRWAYYEAIQADIFDHVFAALPTFDLRPFQFPTGADFSALTRPTER